MIKKTGKTGNKSNKLGGGGRFQQVVDKIMASHPKGGIKEAKAVAAIAGRKALGAKKFNKLAVAGRKRAAKKG